MEKISTQKEEKAWKGRDKGKMNEKNLYPKRKKGWKGREKRRWARGNLPVEVKIVKGEDIWIIWKKNS